MIDPRLAEFSPEELHRLIARDRWVKQMLNERCASLLLENVELMAIVQELQQELSELRQSQVAANLRPGEAAYNGPEPQVTAPQRIPQ